MPDESTIPRFRHRLEQHELTAAMFASVRVLLERKGIRLKSGTVADATILDAPTPTENATGARTRRCAYPERELVVFRGEGAFHTPIVSRPGSALDQAQ